jgi:hypothetical protein
MKFIYFNCYEKAPFLNTCFYIIFRIFSSPYFYYSGDVNSSEDGESLIRWNIYNHETLEGKTSNLKGFLQFSLATQILGIVFF